MLLGGQYAIEEKIGEGAYAEVFSGRDLRLNRKVAIKVFRKLPGNDNISWGHLLSEGRTVSALSHTNICGILDIGEDGESRFAVLEFIDGQTLKAILTSGPLPVRIALQTALDISTGLAHAHSKGILHHDLTPSNVMVNSSGDIKIIDFGLAMAVTGNEISSSTKSQSSIADPGWVTGKLPYVCPEILYGQGASVQTDLWSLGAILYEMLTGHPPFQGRALFEVSMSIMSGKAKPSSTGMPASTRGIVFRCLSRKRESRYQSADEVCRHLDAEIASIDAAHLSLNRLLTIRLQRFRARWARNVY